MSEGDGVGRTRVESLVTEILDKKPIHYNLEIPGAVVFSSLNTKVTKLATKSSLHLHAGRIPPVVDVESGRRQDDDDDEEDRDDDGGLARLAEGLDAAHLVLAVRARVVCVAGAAHVLRLDAHAAVLALADQRLRLRTALGCKGSENKFRKK